MNNRGFTLIELIMVLVLIGIVALFAAPKLGNMTTTNAAVFADKLRADIRYAQNLAMTRGRRTRVQFTATIYSVTQDAGATGICDLFPSVTDPAGSGALLVQINTGNYTGITIGPSRLCLEYDSAGKPYDCTVAPAPGACATTQNGMTITVIANGVTTVDTVKITSQTGAVN
jgi:MSHA pilin protein MshC